MRVYILHHVHIFEDGTQDVKLIGVYSSKGRALHAKDNVKNALGFCHAQKGFRLQRYSVDRAEPANGALFSYGLPHKVARADGDKRVQQEP